MTRIRVVVTAADIDRARRDQQPGRADGATCPLARGVHRAGFPQAHVARQYWRTNAGGVNGRLWNLTKRATAFIDRFDAGEPVHPDIFYLEGPDR